MYVYVCVAVTVENKGRFKQLPVAVALKFTVHGVQSFIKGHRKSGVISIKHSRDITNRISPLTME